MTGTRWDYYNNFGWKVMGIFLVVNLLLWTSVYVWRKIKQRPPFEQGAMLAFSFTVMSTFFGSEIISMVYESKMEAKAPREEYVAYDRPIQALNDASVMEGNVDATGYGGGVFVLSGKLNGVMKYRFMEKEGEGYTLKEIDADRVIVVETANGQAKHVIKKIRYQKPLDRKYYGTTDTEDKEFLYVPKGTLVAQTQIDLK